MQQSFLSLEMNSEAVYSSKPIRDMTAADENSESNPWDKFTGIDTLSSHSRGSSPEFELVILTILFETQPETGSASVLRAGTATFVLKKLDILANCHSTSPSTLIAPITP
jgi:hypothetical protein